MKTIGLKEFSIDIKEYPQIEWKPFFLYYWVRKDKIIQAKLKIKVVAAASTPNYLFKEKAWETLQYVRLDKRFPDNFRRTTKEWQQILQFSLVQQAFKEKKKETCEKQPSENQKLEVIREKVKVKLEPGQSEKPKRKVIPEKEEETCQKRQSKKQKLEVIPEKEEETCEKQPLEKQNLEVIPEKKGETCQKRQSKKQNLEVIREKVKVKLEPGQSEKQNLEVIPEKEEETCQTRNWEKEIAQWKSLGLTVKIVDQDNANPKFIVKYIPCERNVETTKSEFCQDNVEPKPNITLGTTLECSEIILENNKMIEMISIFD